MTRLCRRKKLNTFSITLFMFSFLLSETPAFSSDLHNLTGAFKDKARTVTGKIGRAEIRAIRAVMRRLQALERSEKPLEAPAPAPSNVPLACGHNPNGNLKGADPACEVRVTPIDPMDALEQVPLMLDQSGRYRRK
jgi:hypothetical protein